MLLKQEITEASLQYPSIPELLTIIRKNIMKL